MILAKYFVGESSGTRRTPAFGPPGWVEATRGAGILAKVRAPSAIETSQGRAKGNQGQRLAGIGESFGASPSSRVLPPLVALDAL